MPIDKEVQRHFDAIKEILEIKIVEYLMEKRVESGPLSVDLCVLGRTEQDAQPTIAVFCSKAAIKRTKSFVKKEYVCDIYRQAGANRTKLACEVFELEPKAMDEILVHRLHAAIDGKWGPRIKVAESGGARLATLGGFVCVVDASGRKAVYGLTAGHVLPSMPLYDDDEQSGR